MTMNNRERKRKARVEALLGHHDLMEQGRREALYRHSAEFHYAIDLLADSIPTLVEGMAKTARDRERMVTMAMMEGRVTVHPTRFAPEIPDS